ncbi:MAG: aminotransferase class I/II-fold pyridoxal phosphate-dependent enzyme [Planctomycetaceae bacterium]
MALINSSISESSTDSDRVSRSSPRGESLSPALTLSASDPFQGLRCYEPILARHGMATHFLQSCEGIVGHHAEIDGKHFINFSTYNYLGFSGDSRVCDAAHKAIDVYGTSVSASRLIAGDRPIHRELEREIADLVGAEDSIVFTSGHATNVTSLGCLFGPKDLIIYDILSHNSIQQGIRLSGATAYRFAHNSVNQVDSLLQRHRGKFERALIVTEGVFSMDGDIAPVPQLIEIKRRHRAFLMVDEAHSMGVIGQCGRGIADHFQLSGTDVDIWMGTLSKSLASCGGYIAGRHELVESLRFAAAGFVYTCGMSPATAASALMAARLLKQEPERVQRLAANVHLFKRLAQERGLNTGDSHGSAVVPVILGCSLTSLFAAHLLHERGILVHPLCYPVVPQNAARLRFFLTAMHTTEEIEMAVDSLLNSVNTAKAMAAAELAQSGTVLP